MPKHESIPISPVELIDIAPSDHSPLVSKCVIKVCYVGDKPNRNGSIITRNMAEKMAPSLRGAIIAGYYNKDNQDFEGHKRDFVVENGELKAIDLTRPYGFVDIHADVWFQKFMDDGETEHEYLCTNGWLWTEAYEECKRVIDQGNNQSMELSKNFLDGTWAKNNKGQPEFFILSEAIIEKLTILGEEVEPCFEGSSITSDFSLGADFKHQVFELLTEIKELLTEGGEKSMEQTTPEAVVDEAILEEEKPIEEEFEKKDKKEEEQQEEKEESSEAEREAQEESEDKKDDNEEDEKEKQKKANHALQEEYNTLNQRYSALEQEKLALENELNELREFKKSVERVQKQEMIDSFFMLSNEDKADVINNIDTYSLDDIEAKLSVICVRNKVNLSVSEDKKETDPMVYNLQSENTVEPEIPDWIKALNAVVAENNF